MTMTPPVHRRIPGLRTVLVATAVTALVAPLSAVQASGLGMGVPAAPATVAPAAAPAAAPETASPSQLVDPLIGSANGGNTYPGAVRPFGMISWSPTSTTGDQTNTAAANGYSYDRTRLRGFALTHVNGAGCHPGAAGDLPIFPHVGDMTVSPSADWRDEVYASDFTHADEKAVPGRYSLGLANGAKADLAVTDRAGVGEFSFPADKAANLLFRTSNSLNGSEDADIRIDAAKREVTGSVLTGAFCGRRANGGENNRTTYYRLHFVASFDRAFDTVGTWRDSAITPGSTTATGGEGYLTGDARRGRGSGGWVGFDTDGDRDVQMRVGISYTSLDGARRNLATEVKQRDTTASVAAAGTRAWDQALRSIRVDGGTPEQRVAFTTAMYHAYLQPNITSDVDGAYLGADRKVHQVEPGQGAQYGNFSGWDQYRAHTQLLALLEPEVAGDFAQSLTNLAGQNGGVWDRWIHVNGPTHVMTGDPSAPTLAGLHALGVRNFDVEGAFDSLYRQATVPHPDGLSDAGCPGQCEGQRPNLQAYLDLGYAPQDQCHCWGGAAETLEGSVADFSLADWAGRIGKTAERDVLAPRATWWRNTFNPSAAIDGGYQQARNADGTWVWPFSRSSDVGFAQGTSSTYTWMVPQDVSGLAAAMGGVDRAAERLDGFFHKADGSWATGGDGFRYDPTNEPGIHVPWMYNALGKPWKTQETVRAMADLVYGTGPRGLPGNDDLGTMSAWYVFASLGIYPQTPARAEMLLSSPVFPRATIRRGNGTEITIRAPKASDDNIYVQGVSVDGAPTTKSWLSEDVMNAGGEVVVDVASTPDTTWGTRAQDLPVDHVPTADVAVPNLPDACVPSGADCLQDLREQYDIDGVSTATAKNEGNIDGKGWSFPAEQLPQPGIRTLSGHDFLVPDTAGRHNNFLSLRGQRIHLTERKYAAIDVLATAVNGDQTVPMTVGYTDGTTSQSTLRLTDWASAGGAKFGEATAVTATTRHNVNGTADGRSVRIWHVSLPVEAGRTVAWLQSPNQQNVKLFAVSGRTG